MSSHQRAMLVESDPQYTQEVTGLLSKVKSGQITRRKFASARSHAYQSALKRAGLLLELVTPADDEAGMIGA